MDGMRFLCLDGAALTALAVPHPLHRAKILTHADELRKKVLEGVAAARPVEVNRALLLTVRALSATPSL